MNVQLNHIARPTVDVWFILLSAYCQPKGFVIEGTPYKNRKYSDMIHVFIAIEEVKQQPSVLLLLAELEKA